jgi:hypothetical protein
MKSLIAKLRNPIWLIAAIVIAALAVIFLFRGTAGWLAAGGAAQVITAVIAYGVFAVFIVTTVFLTLTIRPGLRDAISKDLLARAILSGCLILAGAVFVHAIFGG